MQQSYYQAHTKTFVRMCCESRRCCLVPQTPSDDTSYGHVIFYLSACLIRSDSAAKEPRICTAQLHECMCVRRGYVACNAF